MEEPGGTLLGNHTLRTRRITRKRLPQLRHRKARNPNVRRIESNMLLMCDSRVLCQPHRGQLGRSGSVTASTSSFSSISSSGASWSAYLDCCSGSLAISFIKPARSPDLQGHPSSMATCTGRVIREIVPFHTNTGAETWCWGTAGSSAVSSPAQSSVAAHGNWQDAVADVPIALDSFTVAETTVEAATWLAMGCV